MWPGARTIGFFAALVALGHVAGLAEARRIKPALSTAAASCQREPLQGPLSSLTAAGAIPQDMMARPCARLPAVARCYQRAPGPAPAVEGSARPRLDDPRGVAPPADATARTAEVQLERGRAQVTGGSLWPGEAACVERALRGAAPAAGPAQQLALHLGPAAEPTTSETSVSVRCGERTSWRGGASVVVTVAGNRVALAQRAGRSACARLPSLVRCAQAGAGQITLAMGAGVPRPSDDPNLPMTLGPEAERCVRAIARKLARVPGGYQLHLDLASGQARTAE